MIGWGRGKHSWRRFERLFKESRRQLDLQLREIFARHAAVGQLKSGKTVRASVQAFEDTTGAALAEGFAGIAAVTEHAGLKRRILLDNLLVTLREHQNQALPQLLCQIRHVAPENSVYDAVKELFNSVCSRNEERIADFRDGWTAPAPKPWKDRHPIIYSSVVAALGFAIGWAGKSLENDPALSNIFWRADPEAQLSR